MEAATHMTSLMRILQRKASLNREDYRTVVS